MYVLVFVVVVVVSSSTTGPYLRVLLHVLISFKIAVIFCPNIKARSLLASIHARFDVPQNNTQLQKISGKSYFWAK